MGSNRVLGMSCSFMRKGDMSFDILELSGEWG